MIPELSHIKFLKYRDRFHSSVQKSPVSCIITLSVVQNPDDITEDVKSFSDFTGDSTRVETTYTFKCLYQREISPVTRTKFGLNEDVSGLVYLSAKDVEDKIGRWKLDYREVAKLTLYETDYAVSSLMFKEPMFDSCVALEFRVKNLTRF